MMAADPRGARIEEALSFLWKPGKVIELRIPGTKRGTQAGYFDDPILLKQAALKLDKQGPGIYITLNPVNKVLLARGANRVRAYVKQGEGTSDKEIERRSFFPVDFDAVRPAGISSTDEEHDAAILKAKACRTWLKERGWPQPILADSGNGAHLVYAVDLPNDNAMKTVMERCLKALGAQFNDDQVEVDRTTFNASRIWKLYGTNVCKGDSLPDRQHRLASIAEAPESLDMVPLELLEQLAELAPQTHVTKPRSGVNGHKRDSQRVNGDYTTLDVVAWFGAHGHYGGLLESDKHAVLCPWSDQHTDIRPAGDSDTVIWDPVDDKWARFHCSHAHCIDRCLDDVMLLWGDADSYCSIEFQPRISDSLPAQSEVNEPFHSLIFRTAAEIAANTPEETEYISEPWVPAGSLVEFVGKIKQGGKTTFLMAMSRKVLDGLPFMGNPTTKTPIVYLTEQNTPSLRAALARAGLLEREDFHILAYKDTFGTNWPQVVEAAAQKCKATGARLLVVDTIPQWAGLQGTSENDSGAALEALAPLQVVAGYGTGVVCVRHEGKADRAVGDSGRGSSAWGGGVDVIISIRRPGGNSSSTVRVLHCIGRFDELPDRWVIELNTETGEYSAIGTETQLAAVDAVEAVKANAPRTEDEAMNESDLFDAADVKRTTGQQAVDELLKQGLLQVIGKGVKGDPRRYWALETEKDSAATLGNSGKKFNDPDEQTGGENPDGVEKYFLPPLGNVVSAETISEPQPLQEVVVADDYEGDGNSQEIHSAAIHALIPAETISEESERF